MNNEDEKRAELTEHLAELRTRIIRSVIYLTVGTIIAWFSYDFLLDLMTRPMLAIMRQQQAKFLFKTWPEAFMMRLQISILAGIAIISPLLILEMWGFVSPGLTSDEKKYIRWLVPFSALLFIGGMVLCYYILPAAFNWFAGYIPENALFLPDAKESLLFTIKMMVAFGAVFQLPVLLTILSSIGIVETSFLKANWRYAIVIAAIVAAVATPSSDAFSMIMMAVPVVALYFMSIGMVAIVERKRKKKQP